jgi:2-keto-4-pentenoate hydratase/2-oxohepta-3-ene-1,7-dioic acid hydratase in catechol pathway
MRLVRFGPPGGESPGLERPDGSVVDLRRHFPDIPDVSAGFFERGWLEHLERCTLPGDLHPRRLGSPVASPSKIICLGKNYAEHAREGGAPNPRRPLLFCKSANTLSGPRDPILLPSSSGGVDWEVELALVIGRGGKRISPGQAWGHVAGLMVMNDVSAREAQFADSQWYRGKSFDTFAPMGPALVTLAEIGDPRRLRLTARVDGVLMQEALAGEMLFDIPTIIADISADITLLPGDVISTGTPSGVGVFRDPPLALRAGNVVECRIDPLGALINPVVAALP